MRYCTVVMLATVVSLTPAIAQSQEHHAKPATATANEWVVSPPHVMVLYADLKMLDPFPTDPKTGGPWVMWKGTLYVHLMVPVGPTKVATTHSK